MNGFLIIKPGMLTLIQDAGRYGHQHLGLTHGGPMDSEAFAVAHRLLGNPENTTNLEISFGGLQLEAIVPTYICVTGAAMPLTIADKRVALWQTHAVKTGDKIALGFAQRGARCYFSVAGGFQIPTQLGSTATVVRENIGGLRGEALRSGDFLPCSPCSTLSTEKYLAESPPNYSTQCTLNLVPGYQIDQFSSAEQNKFFSSEFQISPQSDRMGYRLAGPAIQPPGEVLLSEGIAPGAVQIPPDGQPIILLADRQTIGGYPKIGSVIQADRDKLGQMKQGDKIRFKKITAEAALAMLRTVDS